MVRFDIGDVMFLFLRTRSIAFASVRCVCAIDVLLLYNTEFMIFSRTFFTILFC